MLQKNKILPTDITQFLNELAILLENEVSLQEALETLQEEQDKFAMQKLIKAIATEVAEKKNLADSLAKYPQYLEPFIIDLLHTAEQKNTLVPALHNIVQYRESINVTESDLTARLNSSLAYFYALFIIASTLLAFALIFVVPEFADIFKSFGANLPGMTQSLLNLSNIFVTYGWLILAIFIILGGFFYTQKARIALYFPLIGELYHKIAITRFLRTCAFALTQGYSLNTAIAATAQAANNPVYIRALQRINQQIDAHIPLSDALRTAKFPRKVIHNVTIGQKTNRMANLLTHLANTYDKQVQQTMEVRINLLTLLVTIIIGLLIGYGIIALYMPFFKLGAAI